MSRPIPGAKFLASMLGVASLFGGAAALADAGRIGLATFVAVPVEQPGPEIVMAAEVAATLPEPAAEADAALAEAEAAGDGPAAEEAVAEQQVAASVPRVRPKLPGESADAAAGVNEG